MLVWKDKGLEKVLGISRASRSKTEGITLKNELAEYLIATYGDWLNAPYMLKEVVWALKEDANPFDALFLINCAAAGLIKNAGADSRSSYDFEEATRVLAQELSELQALAHQAWEGSES